MFGTPLGAALLVSALAGGLSAYYIVFMQKLLEHLTRDGHSGSYIGWVFGLLGLCFSILYCSLQLAVPGICKRSIRLLLLAGAAGLLLGIFSTVLRAILSWIVGWILGSPGEQAVVQIIWGLVALIDWALVGYLIARLYGIPAVRWSSAGFSVLASLLVQVSWFVIGTSHPSIGIHLPLYVVSAFILLFPSAFIVERHMARTSLKGETKSLP